MGIYIPLQGGLADSHTYKIHKALQLYDDRLSLGFHEENREWVIYYRRDRSDPYHPVLGLGKKIDHLTAKDVVDRVMRADTLRHGDKLLNSIRANNEEIIRVQRQRTEEQFEEIAEYLEWGARELSKYKGQPLPYTRIFLSKPYRSK